MTVSMEIFFLLIILFLSVYFGALTPKYTTFLLLFTLMIRAAFFGIGGYGAVVIITDGISAIIYAASYVAINAIVTIYRCHNNSPF